MDRLLDIAEVAARLDVSTVHVRSLIRAGRLRAVEVGLGQRFPRYKVQADALEEFIRKGETGQLDRMKTR